MNNPVKIAICIPSRGMLHSRFMEDVLNNILDMFDHVDYTYRFFFSHGQPQPNAENFIVENALKWQPDVLWILDDDMLLPPQMLYTCWLKMIETQSQVVVAHYPVARNQDALHIRDGQFESAGMGCVLIRPSAFDVLERPYFRCDTQYTWDGEKLVPGPVPDNHEPQSVHGLHDVDFFQRLLKGGITPAIVDLKAGQYNLLDINIRKIGNHTNQTVEEWHLP